MWILLSILAATFRSLQDVLGKHNLNTVNEYVLAFSVRLFAFLVLLPAVIYEGVIPELNETFWYCLLVSTLFNVATSVLYLKAIKSDDLSLTVPFIGFSPFFLLFTSFIISDERPAVQGVFGVLLMVAGTYFFQFKEKKKNFLAPFAALLKLRGPKMMLLVAFLWSISSNFDKIGIKNSSPVFWALMLNLGISFFVFWIVIFKKISLKAAMDKKVALLGILSGMGLIVEMTAISLYLVTYVIAVKRLSTVQSVIWGHFFFKEQGIKKRLFASSVILAGVLLIAFAPKT